MGLFKMLGTLTVLTIFFFFSRINGHVNDSFIPYYHLSPPFGWMNDPNGFCYFRNEYHLFYQYNPESSLEAGIAHWGHAKSKDLFHWEHLPIAMYPDQSYDKTGVFSGSAIIENDTMYLFYTGNVDHPGETPDHEQHQALAISTDGVNVTKYENNPIIIGAEHQPNIRDPKVWEHNGTYYMVLGNSFNNNTLGRVLLYASNDKKNWDEVAVLAKSDGFLGYMWECPDFFELDGQFVLLFSPQGMKAEGNKYRNLYQTGYILGVFDYLTKDFTITKDFQEMDHGHDFYATQTILDSKGRRIVVAWFDMWEEYYPERLNGVTGQTTLPKMLSISEDGTLIQKVIPEIDTARDQILFEGPSDGGTTVPLCDNAAEVSIILPQSTSLILFIEPQILVDDTFNRTAVTITYDAKNGTVTLDRGGTDGIRSTEWVPKKNFEIEVYIDASSVEVICGGGEAIFSSRFFPTGPVQVRLGKESEVKNLRVTQLKQTVFI